MKELKIVGMKKEKEIVLSITREGIMNLMDEHQFSWEETEFLKENIEGVIKELQGSDMLHAAIDDEIMNAMKRYAAWKMKE